MGTSYQENSELTWWNFTSCSSVVNVVKQFLAPTSTLLMIDVKNGKDISLYSNFPDEHEVILCLGTRVRVKGDLDHGSLKVIHCSELNDDDHERSSMEKINIDNLSNSSAGEYFFWSVKHRWDQ